MYFFYILSNKQKVFNDSIFSSFELSNDKIDSVSIIK